MIEINKKAQDFVLDGIDSDGDERKFKLSDYLGRYVVLYFYPKDDTAGCTVEAVDFSDHFGHLADTVVVLGVSRDDIKSHKEFQEKYDIDIALLSDSDCEVHSQYGVLQAENLEDKKVVRSTFLIDKEGIVRYIWKDVKVTGHAEDVLKALLCLQKNKITE